MDILHGLLVLIKYGIFSSNFIMIDSGKTTFNFGNISTPMSKELGINIKWLFCFNNGYFDKI